MDHADLRTRDEHAGFETMQKECAIQENADSMEVEQQATGDCFEMTGQMITIDSNSIANLIKEVREMKGQFCSKALRISPSWSRTYSVSEPCPIGHESTKQHKSQLIWMGPSLCLLWFEESSIWVSFLRDDHKTAESTPSVLLTLVTQDCSFNHSVSLWSTRTLWLVKRRTVHTCVAQVQIRAILLCITDCCTTENSTLHESTPTQNNSVYGVWNIFLTLPTAHRVCNSWCTDLKRQWLKKKRAGSLSLRIVIYWSNDSYFAGLPKALVYCYSL